MLKEHPDHHDADLLLKIYDLRREAVMRDSRATLLRDFWPRTPEDALDVLRSDHPLNRPWRQVTTYWEMVFGMARRGIIHADFLVDNSGEGLVIFARAEAYLSHLRQAAGPRVLQHTEWIANETETGRRMLEGARARVAKALAERR
jgi:hypothetical protein